MPETIEIEVNNTSTIKRKITLPHFVKGNSAFFKVFSKEKAVAIYPTFNEWVSPSIEIIPANSSLTLGKQESTKEEFMKAYEAASEILRGVSI